MYCSGIDYNLGAARPRQLPQREEFDRQRRTQTRIATRCAHLGPRSSQARVAMGSRGVGVSPLGAGVGRGASAAILATRSASTWQGLASGSTIADSRHAAEWLALLIHRGEAVAVPEQDAQRFRLKDRGVAFRCRSRFRIRQDSAPRSRKSSVLTASWISLPERRWWLPWWCTLARGRRIFGARCEPPGVAGGAQSVGRSRCCREASETSVMARKSFRRFCGKGCGKSGRERANPSSNKGL